jgi:hypothetical protein
MDDRPVAKQPVVSLFLDKESVGIVTCERILILILWAVANPMKKLL